MDKDVCQGESLRKGQLKSVCRVSDSHTHTHTQVWWANWTSENSKRNDTQKPHNREDKRAREEKGKKSKFGFRLKADLSLWV